MASPSSPHGNPTRRTHRAGTAASWMALVAGTTLGLGYQGRVRAQISGEGMQPEAGQSYRLVAQSYAASSVTPGGLPGRHARPLGSAQRAITAEQLRAGVAVDIMLVGEEPEAPGAPVVVAWVEPGEPDLDYDARRARPGPSAMVGLGLPDASGQLTCIMLRRTG